MSKEAPQQQENTQEKTGEKLTNIADEIKNLGEKLADGNTKAIQKLQQLQVQFDQVAQDLSGSESADIKAKFEYVGALLKLMQSPDYNPRSRICTDLAPYQDPNLTIPSSVSGSRILERIPGGGYSIDLGQTALTDGMGLVMQFRTNSSGIPVGIDVDMDSVDYGRASNMLRSVPTGENAEEIIGLAKQLYVFNEAQRALKNIIATTTRPNTGYSAYGYPDFREYLRTKIFDTSNKITELNGGVNILS